MSAVPMAIAHRGDPVTERENTMAAFEAAVRAGAEMVELDLQRTRDGEIVVLHDPTLIRLWGDGRAVADLELSEIRAIGTAGRGIPTLREVLAQISVPLMVDFTGPEVVEGAVGEVRASGAMDRALFVTGNVPALVKLRTMAPEARIGLTWTNDDTRTAGQLLEKLEAEYWNPSFAVLSAESVAAVHSLGRLVSTWTVDEAMDIERVVAMGVDAIVSNRIRELRRAL